MSTDQSVDAMDMQFRLTEEADLCAHDGAEDIALLLMDAVSVLSRLAAERDALASRVRALEGERDVLRDTLDHIAKTIDRQLELIKDRAPGAFLDKRPVTQSLALHARRARAALTTTSGDSHG